MTHSNVIKSMITIYQRTKNQPVRYPRCNSNGFTLVETMIAGLIMSIVLVAVSRFSISAISTSSHQSTRRMVEAAMNNDIQLIQQADSELRLIDIPEGEQKMACDDPGLFLKTKLLSPDSVLYVQEPDLPNQSNTTSLIRTIQSSSDPIMTTITYTFQAPEKHIESETRRLTLYPNFHYLCDVN